jgi:hypothetical protein
MMEVKDEYLNNHVLENLEEDFKGLVAFSKKTLKSNYLKRLKNESQSCPLYGHQLGI